jgi:hypothetical protein
MAIYKMQSYKILNEDLDLLNEKWSNLIKNLVKLCPFNGAWTVYYSTNFAQSQEYTSLRSWKG